MKSWKPHIRDQDILCHHRALQKTMIASRLVFLTCLSAAYITHEANQRGFWELLFLKWARDSSVTMINFHFLIVLLTSIRQKISLCSWWHYTNLKRCLGNPFFVLIRFLYMWINCLINWFIDCVCMCIFILYVYVSIT